MKKLILVCFLILISTSNASASNDFRNFRWGIPNSEVINNEKSTFIDNKFKSNTSQLIYKDMLLGNECHIIYTFIDNKLISGDYIFNIYGESTRFILFKKLTDHFVKKYEPINKENNKSQHGFKAAYKTSTTRIDILNENGKLTVKYTPLELYKQKSDDDLSFF